MKKVPCGCACHAKVARVLHIVACCDGGFKEIPSTPKEWLRTHSKYDYPAEALEKIARIIDSWEKYRIENLND